MKRNYTILLAAGLIIITAAMRIFNAEMHIYNIWGVTALGLFSGAMVKDKRVAFLFTLLAQLSSDLYSSFSPLPLAFTVSSKYLHMPL